MTNQKLFNGIVQHGDEKGRTIGFPTLNFDPSILASEKMDHGVYVTQVRINSRQYQGLLYYGPRMAKGESFTVLEIHVLDFNEEIYGAKVGFTIGSYIRPAMPFDSLQDLQAQIQKDVQKVTASS